MDAFATSGAGRRERVVVGLAMAIGLAIRAAYVIHTRGQALAGDQIEYDIEGRLIAAGHWFWSTTPYGIAHPSMWKAPGYSAWVGVWYGLIGAHPMRLELVQTLLGPLTILLTWLLGRRLFGPRVGVVAAAVVAIYPFAWQYETRLYSESLATPLTLGVLLMVLGKPPTWRRALGAGALMGVSVLVRPTSAFLFAGLAIAWWLAVGVRRGTAMVALSVAVAALVIAPWTYRNYRLSGAFVPVSVQDAATYGTFNPQAANDPVHPYAWRPVVPGTVRFFDHRHPLPEAVLRDRLQSYADRYIAAHPASLPQAFFWNGLSRLWDVRRPGQALHEVGFQGRSRTLTIIGLAMYYVLLPLALIGLWRARRRRGLVLAVLAIALAASVVFTVDSGTRYRATLEPVIVILAVSAVLPLSRAPRRRTLAEPTGSTDVGTRVAA